MTELIEEKKVIVEDVVEETKEEEELTQEEKDEKIKKTFGEMTLSAFAELFIRAFLGENYPQNMRAQPNYFYAREYKVTEESHLIEKMFYDRIREYLKMKCFKKPDQMFLAVYGREAGGSLVSRFSEDINYISLMNLNSAFEIKHEGQSIALATEGEISKPCRATRFKKEMNKNKKEVVVSYASPNIPKNSTTFRYERIQVTPIDRSGKRNVHRSNHTYVKNRDYCGIALWFGWKSEEEPIESEQKISEDQFAELFEKQKQKIAETPKN